MQHGRPFRAASDALRFTVSAAYADTVLLGVQLDRRPWIARRDTADGDDVLPVVLRAADPRSFRLVAPSPRMADRAAASRRAAAPRHRRRRHPRRAVLSRSH